VTDKKTCFVIAPIGAEGSEVRRYSEGIYAQVLLPLLASYGYEVVRADKLTRPGSITEQIVELLIGADLVVADLTGRNPNVMYELGVRHANGQPVILMIAADESLPFDVAGMRTIVFDRDAAGMERLREQLAETIEYVAASGKAESPVSAFRQLQELKEPDSAGSKAAEGVDPIVLSNVLKSIEQRLDALQNNMDSLAHKPDREHPEYSRDVFIVHGHDGELKNELARFLEKLEFNPVILHEQPDRGRTVFAKLTGELRNVGYAFILLTPDDVGAAKASAATPSPRARQNVVFEHGLFVGHLAPDRVCAILKGNVEIPSDLAGIVYKGMPEGGSLDAITYDIVKELRAAGYFVDANKI
jgi:predicted nucleotide-binding protein